MKFTLKENNKPFIKSIFLNNETANELFNQNFEGAYNLVNEALLLMESSKIDIWNHTEKS